jgi:Ca2+-binding RTX toxin-like protein
VAGDDLYRTDIEVGNSGAADVAAALYHAGDCYLQNDDEGYGFVDPAGGGIYCSKNPNNVPPARIEGFIPLSSGSHFYEDFYFNVWGAMDGSQFPDTCDCSVLQDNGAGLSWDLTVPAGGSVTRSLLTAFSPQGEPTSPEGPAGASTCEDGLDNDGDGKTDAADPDCQAPPPSGDDLCFGEPATITGNGTVNGTNGDDVIITGNRADTVDGKGGNDRICTHGGDDHVRGGTGNDRINSGNGNDDTGGQAGNDIVQSTGGNDDVQGGDGMDRVQGGEGNDTLNGGNGSDSVEGQGGNDLLAGNADAPDNCDGGAGTDKVAANGGCEVIANVP